MLKVDDIDLYYGAAQALRGVSLTAGQGQITCVLGRNGVGKTSLMRAIVGQQAIRRGAIGFDGLLMTDDIDMKALSGTPGEKAAGAIAAGCDLVLDCWARMPEMIEIAGRLGEIAPRSRERLDAAMASVPPAAGDFAALIAKRDALLAVAAA